MKKQKQQIHQIKTFNQETQKSFLSQIKTQNQHMYLIILERVQNQHVHLMILKIKNLTAYKSLIQSKPMREFIVTDFYGSDT